MYRVSKFTLCVPKDKEFKSVILFSGLSGQSIVMFRYRWYEILSQLPNITQSEEMEHLLNGFFIVEESQEEPVEMGVGFERLASQRWSAFSLMPTFRCNQRCSYCYQDHKAVDMEESVMEQTLQWIISHFDRERSRKLDLHFFGGEPLVRKDLIVKLTDSFREFSEEEGIDLKLWLTSNLTLFDEKIADHFSNGDMHEIMCTLDGIRADHDARRPFRERGKSAYDAVIEGLSLACEVADIVSIRMNLDRSNISGLSDLLDEIMNLGISNLYLEPAPVVDVLDRYTGENISYTQQEWGTLLPLIKQMIENRGMSIKPKAAGIPSNQIDGCNAYSFRKPIITPEGNICFCDYLTQDSSQYYGNISTGIDTRGKMDMLRKRYELNSCESCSFFYSCGGPCLALMKQESGCRFIRYYAHEYAD